MAAATGDILGPRKVPAAFGFITLFFGIGQALGPYSTGRNADTVGSYGPAFMVAAISKSAVSPSGLNNSSTSPARLREAFPPMKRL